VEQLWRQVCPKLGGLQDQDGPTLSSVTSSDGQVSKGEPVDQVTSKTWLANRHGPQVKSHNRTLTR
jgi:hypothetical protein